MSSSQISIIDFFLEQKEDIDFLALDQDNFLDDGGDCIEDGDKILNGIIWNSHFDDLRAFKNEHGHANPTEGHLAAWLDCQRNFFHEGEFLTTWQLEALRDIGCNGFETTVASKAEGDNSINSSPANLLTKSSRQRPKSNKGNKIRNSVKNLSRKGQSKECSRQKLAELTKKRIAYKRRTEKQKQLREQRLINSGKWTTEERLRFLKGLRKFGPGNWKGIRTFVPSRSTIQIKSHGQKVLNQLKNGVNIYKELEQQEAAKVESSVESLVKK